MLFPDFVCLQTHDHISTLIRADWSWLMGLSDCTVFQNKYSCSWLVRNQSYSLSLKLGRHEMTFYLYSIKLSPLFALCYTWMWKATERLHGPQIQTGNKRLKWKGVMRCFLFVVCCCCCLFLFLLFLFLLFLIVSFLFVCFLQTNESIQQP